MIVVSVASDIKALASRLTTFSERRIRFNVAQSLTRTAKDAQEAIKANLPRVFDRPNNYTINSTYYSRATPENLTSSIQLKDQTGGRGVPASKYLAPSIFGGARNVKRVELALAGKGIVPNGMTVAPGSGAKLDSYGNVTRGQYGQIISQLGGQSIAETKRKGKRGASYFVPSENSKLHQGVWARNGASIQPVLFFVTVPKYKKQFNFFGDVHTVIRARFGEHLSAAISADMARTR